MLSINGKIVVITGAGSGIGLAAAMLFREYGAVVIAWDLAFSENYPEDIHTYKVDVSEPASVNEAAEEVIRKFARIDVLINNAGITRDATLQKMSFEQWKQVLDVNLTGVFNCTKAVTPFMIRQHSGKVINTSSVVAHNGNYGQTNYVATKSGVIGMTKVWARELGKYGITVNAVAPGFINTEMISTVPEKVIDNLKQKSALQKIGQPDDVAKAYLFLASDMADYITAHTLNVDGGLVI